MDLDVSSLLATDGILEIEVAADHPDALPLRKRVPIPPRVREAGGAGAVLALELSLVRAAPLVGRVVDARSAPVPDAVVGAFVCEGQKPAEVSSDTVRTGPDGGFRLRLPPGTPCVLFAGARTKRSAFREIRGGDATTPDIVLEDGAVIAGTVTDGAGLPMAKVALRAEPHDLKDAVRIEVLGEGMFILAGGGSLFGLPSVPAVTDADGRYAIPDLEPGKYRVTIEGLADEDALPDAFEDYDRVVDAPATGVDFHVEFVRLRVTIRVDGGRVPSGAFLHVRSRYKRLVTRMMEVGKEGVLDLLARSGSTYTLNLWAGPDYLGERKVEVPRGSPTAEATVDFKHPEPRGSLVVRLESPGGAPTRAGFGFFEPGAEDDFAPEVSRDVDGREGRFLLSNLPAGRWKMVVRAGGDWFGGEGYFLEEATEVVVPSSGERELRVLLRPGGRIRIDARNREHLSVEADCDIQDSSGRSIPASFHARMEGGGWVTCAGTLVKFGENVVDPALPEGTYTLRFTADGFRERTETVKVRLGETAKVWVVLERNP